MKDEDIKSDSKLSRRHFLCRGCKAMLTLGCGVMTTSVSTVAATALTSCSKDEESCSTFSATISSADATTLRNNGYLNISGAMVFYQKTTSTYTAFGNCCPEGGGGTLAASDPDTATCQLEPIQSYNSHNGRGKGTIDYSNTMTAYGVTVNSDGTLLIFKS